MLVMVLTHLRQLHKPPKSDTRPEGQSDLGRPLMSGHFMRREKGKEGRSGEGRGRRVKREEGGRRREDGKLTARAHSYLVKQLIECHPTLAQKL